MIITINGEKQTIEADRVTVQKLLEIKNVKDQDMVSVQLNGNFVKREVFAETPVLENDIIDFLYFMGGGM
ncbi:MAG: sulfur carrier protein ThiS [Candidatus Latescibacter sp.]|nr:sulfur carrier protein ThiS [Candidatus Latescibacter sp.]